jgi:hypothetical protein
MQARGTFDASGKTVHLRIQDQGLGSMEWHLRMEGGRVAAEAVVQSARIQQLVQSHHDVLQARLADVGVEMEGFEVSVDQGSQQFSRHAQEKNAPTPLPGHDPVCDTSIEHRHERRGIHIGAGGLDLYA